MQRIRFKEIVVASLPTPAGHAKPIRRSNAETCALGPDSNGRLRNGTLNELARGPSTPCAVTTCSAHLTTV